MFFGNSKLEAEIEKKDALIARLQKEMKTLKEFHKKELHTLVKDLETLEVEHKRLQQEHKEYVEKVESLTTIDIESGASNKRYFYDVIESLMLLAKREKTPLTLAVLNVVEFESLECDESLRKQALQALVRRISTQIRESDIFVRLQNAKFIVAFPNTPQEQAEQVCKKLEKITAEKPILTDLYCSLSTGVATFGENENVNMVLQKAEESMR